MDRRDLTQRLDFEAEVDDRFDVRYAPFHNAIQAEYFNVNIVTYY